MSEEIPELPFARINPNAEVEPCSYEDWIAKPSGTGTILKETIGDWIVTLSFTGIGTGSDHVENPKHWNQPAFWEISEYHQRKKTVNVWNYASEEEATESFFESVERIRSKEQL